MSRTKKVIYNTLTAALGMVVHQVIALVVSIKVLEVYGPDFHGLNSILSNVMTWVLILEGGLTTATTVALYKPYINKDFDECNHILSASRIQFGKIGALIFAVGAALAFFYPFFITSDIPYWDICLMFLIMSFSTTFGVAYTRRYAVMYSVTQHEYINQLIKIAFSIVGSAVIYVLAINRAHYLWVRTIYMLSTVFTGLAVAFIIKRKFRFLNYREIPKFEAIKGTKDVVVQKLTSVIRGSAPAIFISFFDTTVAASIYAVNMYGYNFVRSIMQNVLTATQSGIGQVVAEKDTKGVYAVFRSFEYAVITILLWLMSSAIAVSIPFVLIYSHGVEGVNYISYFLWLVLPLNYAIQVSHLPSGVIINMYGRFKEDKRFQINTMIVMLAAMGAAGAIWGLNGVVSGATVGSVALAVQEIRFARKKLLRTGYGELIRPILIDLLVLVPLLVVEFTLIPYHLSIAEFFFAGIVVVIVHGIALMIVNWLFERERMKGLILRFSAVILKKNR